MLDFADLDSIEVVGIYPDYAARRESLARRRAAHGRRCGMEFVVVHLHRLLEPDVLDTPRLTSCPSRSLWQVQPERGVEISPGAP